MIHNDLIPTMVPSCKKSPGKKSLCKRRAVRAFLLKGLLLLSLSSLFFCASDDKDDPDPPVCSVSPLGGFSNTTIMVSSIYQLSAGETLTVTRSDFEFSHHWAVIMLPSVTANTTVDFSFDPRYEIPGIGEKAALVYTTTVCPLTDRESDYDYPMFSFGGNPFPADMSENYSFDETEHIFDFSQLMLEAAANFSIVIAPTDDPRDGQVIRTN